MTTTPAQAIAHLWATLFSSESSPDATAILLIRLPRTVLALLIGAALAQTGAVTQGIFRNPMADPSLLGVSSGAAFAAALVIVLGPGLAAFDSHRLPYLLPVACFCGGAFIAWIIARLASVDGYTRISTLLLGGLAITALINAGIGLLSYLANDTALRSLTFWMFGSLGKAGWDEILIATPFILIPLLLIPRHAAELNALLLGEAEAAHLGVNVERVKRRLMLLVILAVSTSVSVAGVIGFVGLIVPHLLRLWAGPDHRLLLPASALLGGLLLTGADIVSRTLIAPSEIPIGILTALIGGPFFLALLLHYRKRAESL
jgi:iron complex transport system permease protein